MMMIKDNVFHIVSNMLKFGLIIDVNVQKALLEILSPKYVILNVDQMKKEFMENVNVFQDILKEFMDLARESNVHQDYNGIHKENNVDKNAEEIIKNM